MKRGSARLMTSSKSFWKPSKVASIQRSRHQSHWWSVSGSYPFGTFTLFLLSAPGLAFHGHAPRNARRLLHSRAGRTERRSQQILGEPLPELLKKRTVAVAQLPPAAAVAMHQRRELITKRPFQ